MRWFSLFNGLDLALWHTYDWLDRVLWDRDALLFDKPGIYRAEARTGYWDHYILSAEVRIDPGTEGWYSFQLTARDGTVLCRLQPRELVVDCIEKTPRPTGVCATGVKRAGTGTPTHREGRWFELQIQVANDTLVASIDGHRCATATLPLGGAGAPGFMVHLQGDCALRLRSVRTAFLPPPTTEQRLVYGDQPCVVENGVVQVPFWDDAHVRSGSYWREDIDHICRTHGLPHPDTVSLHPAASNVVLTLDDSSVCKILLRDGYPEPEVRQVREAEILRTLSAFDGTVYNVKALGTTQVRLGHPFLVRPYIDGQPWSASAPRLGLAQQRQLAKSLGVLFARLHTFDDSALECFDLTTHGASRQAHHLVRDSLQQLRTRYPGLFDTFDEAVLRWRPSLAQARPCLIHGDLRREHVIVAPEGDAPLAGVVGWALADCGCLEQDLVAVHVSLFSANPAMTNAFLDGYRCGAEPQVGADRLRLHTLLHALREPPLLSRLVPAIENAAPEHRVDALTAAVDTVWDGVDT